MNGKNYKPSGVTIKNTVLGNNVTKITRTSKYTTNNVTIVDTYIFDGKETDITLFPVTHTIEINRCPNCKYIYKYGIYSPRMLIDADNPDAFTNTTLTYNIQGSRTFNVRLYDPLWNVSGNLTKNLLSLDPQNATATSVLNCNVYADFTNFTNISYTNGTNYTITFWYFKNAVLQTAYTSTVTYNRTPIAAYSSKNVTEYLTRGDVWQCRSRYSTTSGAPAVSPLLISANSTIVNSVPNITSRTPDNQGSAYAKHSKIITLSWTGTDADTSDTITYYVYGYIGE
jgi:hypothetical protein